MTTTIIEKRAMDLKVGDILATPKIPDRRVTSVGRPNGGTMGFRFQTIGPDQRTYEILVSERQVFRVRTERRSNQRTAVTALVAVREVLGYVLVRAAS